jgi:hypothetical protein
LKPFHPDLIFYSDDNDSLVRAQNKMFPLKYLGDDYENVFITYIPARELDYYYCYKNQKNEKFNYNNNDLPYYPLIKITKEKLKEELSQTELIKCFLSGKRSAIIFDTKNQKPIRLKGCGNLFIGFNLANVDDLGENHLEIKGAQFKNTCLREQYISHQVNLECIKRNLIPGNIPLGFYHYGSELPQPLKK